MGGYEEQFIEICFFCGILGYLYVCFMNGIETSSKYASAYFSHFFGIFTKISQKKKKVLSFYIVDYKYIKNLPALGIKKALIF